MLPLIVLRRTVVVVVVVVVAIWAGDKHDETEGDKDDKNDDAVRLYRIRHRSRIRHRAGLRNLRRS